MKKIKINKDTIIAFVIFLATLFAVRGLYLDNYADYVKEKPIEFVIKNKISQPPAYRRSTEYAFIVKDSLNKQYYMYVTPLTYYNYNIGNKVKFIVSQDYLDFCSGNKKETALEAFNVFICFILIIISVVVSLLNLTAFRDKTTMLEKVFSWLSLLVMIYSLGYLIYVHS